MRSAAHALPWLAAARLAPSAHNSQPWRLRAGAGGVVLGWDPARELPAGDPRGHYLLTGLGAAAESMALAGGLAVTFALDRGAHAAARLMPDGRAADDRLAAAIGERHTSRLPYRTDPVPNATLERLADAAAERGARLTVVAGRRAVARVAELIAEGTARNTADAAVLGELHGWLRLRRDDSRRSRDGLTAEALALGPVARAAAAWALEPARVARLGRPLHQAVGRSQGRLARRAPAFCLVTVEETDAAAVFAGGRALQRAWLAATAAGVRVQPMTAAMDHDTTRTALADAFGVPAGVAMIACLRVGFGPAGRRSPRLPAAELVGDRDH